MRTVALKLQSWLRLNNLDHIELSGTVSTYTHIKLLKHFVFELPFTLGRTIRGVDYSASALDIFLQALEKEKSRPFDLNHFSRLIADVYSDELGLLISDKIPITHGSLLGSLPLWAMSYPWELQSPFDKVNCYLSMVIANRSSYFPKSSLRADKHLDPDSFGMSHAIQFSNLLTSILDNGYQPSRSRPGVYILRSGKQWRWVMSGSGNHRSYILNHLGSQSLPAEIIGVINRNHLNQLPLVRQGVYTVRIAEHIFDSVFSGSTSLRGIM